MSATSWTKRNEKKPVKEAKWYVFAGRAYPRVQKGSNTTTRVTSDSYDRDAFYNDPAVVLSDADLDRFNGTEGKPLCVEHNLNDRVGEVFHSWIGDGDKRSLKIFGRVSLESVRGRQVVADIKAGRYKGLSVGYGTELVSNHRTGVTELSDKNFREISLVAEPFFDGCHLAGYGVTATKNPNHNNGDQNSNLLFLRVDASREILSSSSQMSDQPGASSSSPSSQGPVSGDELLGQAAQLKDQLTQETKAKETQAQEMASMKAELEQLRQLKDRVAAKEKAAAEKYAAEQMPKFEAYVAELAASKIPVTDAMKADLKVTFTDPRLKEGAAHLEAEYRQKVELRASLKAAEERVKAIEEEKKKLESAVTKTTQVLNHSRSEFANAIKPKDVNEQDDRHKVQSQDVEASGLNRIMCCEPSLEEMPFLQAYGFRAEGSVGVTASAAGYGYGRAAMRSVPVAASHAHLYNEEGERNNPASGRWADEKAPHRLMFGWMTSLNLATDDLSDVVRMREDKNTISYKHPSQQLPQQAAPVGN